MAEYLQATPAQKKIIEILSNMKPQEYITVTADKDGRPDTFILHISSKILVSGNFVSYLKVGKDDLERK